MAGIDKSDSTISVDSTELERGLADWVQRTTGITLEFQDDLVESLKSGVILCTLANKIRPGSIPKVNHSPNNLAQVENISVYLQACWKFGLPSSDMFVIADLHQKRNRDLVLKNICALYKFCPQLGYKAPKLIFGQKRDPKDEELRVLQEELKQLKSQLSRLEVANGELWGQIAIKNEAIQGLHAEVAAHQHRENKVLKLFGLRKPTKEELTQMAKERKEQEERELAERERRKKLGVRERDWQARREEREKDRERERELYQEQKKISKVMAIVYQLEERERQWALEREKERERERKEREKERERREKEQREKELERQRIEKERREKERRDRILKEMELREKQLREQRDNELRELEWKEREKAIKEAFMEREMKEKHLVDKQAMEKELMEKVRQLRENETKEKELNEKEKALQEQEKELLETQKKIQEKEKALLEKEQAMKEKELRDKQQREKEQAQRAREQKEKEQKEKLQKEKEHKEKEQKEREQKEKERKEKEQEDKAKQDKEQQDKEQQEKEQKEKEQKEKEKQKAEEERTRKTDAEVLDDFMIIPPIKLDPGPEEPTVPSPGPTSTGGPKSAPSEPGPTDAPAVPVSYADSPSSFTPATHSHLFTPVNFSPPLNSTLSKTSSLPAGVASGLEIFGARVPAPLADATQSLPAVEPTTSLPPAADTGLGIFRALAGSGSPVLLRVGSSPSILNSPPPALHVTRASPTHFPRQVLPARPQTPVLSSPPRGAMQRIPTPPRIPASPRPRAPPRIRMTTTPEPTGLEIFSSAARAQLLVQTNDSDARIASLEHDVEKWKNLYFEQVELVRDRLSSEGSGKGKNLLDIVDPELLSFAGACLQDILWSRPAEFSDAEKLNELFKTDLGRRNFAKILDKFTKNIPSVVMLDQSFELLLYLMNTFLQEMDTSDSKDFTSVRILMRISCSLSRVVNGKTEYMQDFIKHYDIWKHVYFWEESFYEELSKQHQNRNIETNEMDYGVVTNLLSSFAHNMNDWGVEADDIYHFVYDMCSRSAVPAKDTLLLLENVRVLLHLTQEANSNKKTIQKRPHNFVERSFGRPTWCDYCSEFVWGILTKQVFVCEECKLTVHGKCKDQVLESSSCGIHITDEEVAPTRREDN
eukprot:Phypoly_transcript_00387.p1 GENE.Phypoly_transcript_00387~~Phypoly_transcript_00387.p1  ORF type:complete len:1116 (+),score=301.59 Phypoly_transcript_00387:141-3488(+)